MWLGSFILYLLNKFLFFLYFLLCQKNRVSYADRQKLISDS